MNPSDFVHLHVHTEYSLLDGACRIDRLMERLGEIGQTAVAITDHGVMYGCVEFYKQAQKHGIKPIIGCEAYVAPRGRADKVHRLDSSPYHLVLLCKNAQGYQNLIKLISIANIEGFYNKPRVDRELLERYHEGLICLSACLAGEIPQNLLAGDYDAALETAAWYKQLFGEDYYIELQDHGIEEQIRIMPDLIRLARELDIPLVATNDCHYVAQRDSEVQRVLICVQTKKTFGDDDVLEFKTNNFYVRTADEMAELFAHVPEAVANTAKIAERCNFDFEFGVTKLPTFTTPDGSDNVAFFEKKCRKGLALRYNHPDGALGAKAPMCPSGATPPQRGKGQEHVGANCVRPQAEKSHENVGAGSTRPHVGDVALDVPQDLTDIPGQMAAPAGATERLEYEMSVIEQMGYVDYYLIVWDFINYAKSRDIPVGPGRGSGAGSLCAYCLGITGIDPIKYQLLFERFLNPERVSMPDFDIDFCYERRGEVLDYVTRKYGADHVAQIITFGTMMARAAVRDVGRVLGMAYSQVDVVAKLIPQELNITIERALERAPELKQLYDGDPEVRRLIDVSRQLEGMPRHASTHAAGVVITRDEASDYVPLAVNDGQAVTQYTMTTLEELGLLKMDFLGLRTLTVLRDCQNTIRRARPDFDIDRIPDDDPQTYEMLAAGNTVGVFQFESGGMRNVLMGLKGTHLEDLIAVVSLYRPGPMESIPLYLENARHPEKIKYKHPLLKPILEVTNGVIIYQEQVMQIFRELGGFSYGQADIVRRAMSKKKHSVMEEEGRHFVEGCQQRGISKKIADEIYADMADFASYAFNKSHAAAYAWIAYQTAYLKCHYPLEFMAAMLTSVLENTDRVIEYISECRQTGIEVLPPDINVSGHGFSADGGRIRFGLQAIKGVGQGLIAAIERERAAAGPFKSFLDFCRRVRSTEMNRKALECLIKCGAFDSFGLSRRALALGMEGVLKSIDDDVRGNVDGQMSMFGQAGTEEAPAEAALPQVEEYDLAEQLRYEKELTGLYLSGHPLLKYAELKKQVSPHEIREFLADDSLKFDNAEVDLLVAISSVRIKVTKSNTTIAFVNIEDMTGMMEMMVFSSKLDQYSSLLKEGNILIISGRLSVKEDDPIRFICNEVYTPEEIQRRGELRSPAENKKASMPAGDHRSPLHLPRDAGEGQGMSGTPSPTKIYIKLDNANDPRLPQLTALFSIFSGNLPVHFFYADTRENVRLPQKLWVTPHRLLVEELYGVMGQENVIFK